MEMYHVPVGREEKREWWDPMTSLKATWTLMNVPRATVVVGENESFENPKIAEPSRARKSREIETFS
jgi:hypothetical protein